MTTTTDFDYFKNKRTDRLYLSKSLDAKIAYKDESGEIKELIKPFRIISKVIDGNEAHVFIKEGKEVSLRITDGERHEITAKFYEDSRGIYTLQIQKYTMATGTPHNSHFTFTGEEILKLHNFIRNISLIPIQNKESAKLDDKFVEEIVLTKEQAIKLINENHELITEIINSEVTPQDISNLSIPFAHWKNQQAKPWVDSFLSQIDSIIEKRLNEKIEQLKPKQEVKYLCRKEVSQILKVSLVTLSTWTKNEMITSYRIGSRIFYKSTDVEDALIKRKFH